MKTTINYLMRGPVLKDNAKEPSAIFVECEQGEFGKGYCLKTLKWAMFNNMRDSPFLKLESSIPKLNVKGVRNLAKALNVIADHMEHELPNKPTEISEEDMEWLK